MKMGDAKKSLEQKKKIKTTFGHWKEYIVLLRCKRKCMFIVEN